MSTMYYALLIKAKLPFNNIFSLLLRRIRLFTISLITLQVIRLNDIISPQNRSINRVPFQKDLQEEIRKIILRKYESISQRKVGSKIFFSFSEIA